MRRLLTNWRSELSIYKRTHAWTHVNDDINMDENICNEGMQQ